MVFLMVKILTANLASRPSATALRGQCSVSYTLRVVISWQVRLS